MTMNQRVIDLPRLERAIVEPRVPQPVDFAQPHHRENLPDYVTPTDGVPPIGVLSAAAVIRMHEEAAQAIEALIEEQKRVNALVIDELTAAAASLRQQGKAQFALVEGWALHTAEVRKTCEAMQKKTVADLAAAS
jgi:hypothetical protein